MEKEILIYQPSKVGSTSVFVHLMNHYNLNRNQVITCPTNNGNYPVNVSHRIYHTHHETTIPLGLKKKIKDPNEPIYFITMTRDPISRNLSSFFEMPQHKKNISKGAEFFIKNYDHQRGIRWYDHQMRDYLGFDIYEGNFNKEKGFKIYKKGNKKLLFIRAEDITEKINEGVSSLLDEDINTELINKNITKNKYSEYDNFKKKIKIPKKILDDLYESKHIKHFYSDNEIKIMRSKWT